MARLRDLTDADVKRRVNRIKRLAVDGESAHAAEDRLYRDVLRAIAAGAAEAPALARTALAAEKVEFSRWYA